MHTDSSVREVREEANAHADAYGDYHRSLNEIEEVTEPPTNLRSLNIVSSSPPSGIDDSILKSRHRYSSLFGDVVDTSADGQRQTHQSAQYTTEDTIATTTTTEASTSEESNAPQQSGGFFSRLASIWGRRETPITPALHPLLVSFDHLPKLEPWTKTHYKTLDRLYQLFKADPDLFSTSPSTTYGTINAALLQEFLSATKLPFVGAEYECWGYAFTMEASFVVIGAVFLQLLTLRDIEEYENKSGKEIEMGRCRPGIPGTLIDGEKVVQRLATVIIGECVRRDEAKGIEIRRNGTMEVQWPQ